MFLSQSKVLVTGGALRIGKAICEAFASAGAAVRIHYNNSAGAAEELGLMLPSPPSGMVHEAFQCDFLKAGTATLSTMLEGCDILVNNASIYHSPSQVIPEDRLQDQRKVNYEIPLQLMELFASMHQRGCIINLLDAVAIDQEIPESDLYRRSKSELKKATLEKAVTFAPGIRVNGVAPGAIIPPSWLAGSQMKKSVAMMPLKKAPTVQDVADACVFLAKNDGITGDIIFVDGGRHLIR